MMTSVRATRRPLVPRWRPHRSQVGQSQRTRPTGRLSWTTVALEVYLVGWLACSCALAAPVKLVYDLPAYAFLLSQQQQQQQHQQRHFMETIQQQADQTQVSSSIYRTGDGPSSLSSARDSLDVALDSLVESSLEKLFERQPHASANLSTSDQELPITSASPNVQVSVSVPLAFGERKLIRLSNGHTYHMCNSTSQCDGEHKVCAMNVCVCKPGYYEQSSSCRSIGDLLKDCQNDLQCQAINVDLICDSDLHERPVCDCAEGLYFEPETHRCLPCHRNILIHTTANMVADQRNKTNMQSESTKAQAESENSTKSQGADQPSSADQMVDDFLASIATDDQHYLRPCLAVRDMFWKQYSRLANKPNSGNSSTRLANLRGYYEQAGSRLQTGAQASNSQSSAGQNLAPQLTQSTTTFYGHSSSDPFRIKTPLHVFMGAIMLFTLFTVAWFFLQRMIHDCRAILRSLRNQEHHFTTTTTTSPAVCASDQNIIGTLASRTASGHHFFDPTSQAVARLIASDSVYGNGQPPLGVGLTSGMFQRDLAGAMVQHLAANLTPSSTSNTLVGANGSTRTLSPGLGPSNEHEAALYSFAGPTGASAQSRHAAAAAAAQLLLSPTHPAIAILRAAAASAAHNPCHGADLASANLLSSILDPPPKYEEAIAYSNPISYSSNPIQAIDEQHAAASTDTDNNADQELRALDHAQDYHNCDNNNDTVASDTDDNPPTAF